MLYTILERLRAFLDEPTADAKYSNAFMVNHLISPSMVEVLSRLSLTFDNPIILRHELTTVDGQQFYQLPPNIGEILRVAEIDDEGRVTKETLPRSLYSPRGQGWSIEGNLLSISPYPTANTETFDIFYIPNGDFRAAYFDGSAVAKAGRLDATRKILTIATSTTPSPTLGALDFRENAYAGATLRLWKENNTLVEERVIASSDVSLNTITVRSAFTTDIEAGSTNDLRFELIPSGFQSLWQAITASAAIKLGTMRNISQKQMQFLVLQYKTAIKTIGDNLSYMQNRIPKHYDKQTVDNRHGWQILD
tara:strand:+ start:341 stop:1261 length:921 start_codon:yes stop_codon:yes gene_type:complete